MCGAPVLSPVTMRYDDFMDSAAMCGGPVLRPVTMGYAQHMAAAAAAAEAMDVGSPPAPSTSSGSSSPGTSPPPGDDTLSSFFTASPPPPPPPWQHLLAKAERGMPKAAPPSWQRLLAKAESDLPPTAARLVAKAERGLPPSWQVPRPNRKGSKATRPKCGAPLPPPPPMPIAVVLEPPAPPADVIDVGPSAPSTPPSDCSCSPAAPRVEVRQVWAHNLDHESKLIESLIPKFPYVAVDTEFPGTVHRPAGPVHGLTAQDRYDLLRRNVDDLHLIQIGLTLFDSGGRLPGYVWEFSLREFDVRRHRHAPESIAMLRVKGVDFDTTRKHGVDAAALGPRLRRWLRAGLGRAGVVTFSGGYDVACLVKMVFGDGYKMPEKVEEFEGVAKAMFRRRRLFDVKEMAGHCPGDLRGGLSTVAVKLDVERAVGEVHKAGSDSLLTCHVFMKMKECFFGDDDELTRLAGVVTGMTG